LVPNGSSLQTEARSASRRTLWLAIPAYAWSSIFREAIGEILLQEDLLRLIVTDEERKEIDQWIPSNNGEY
jgi:hypothetical protein